MLEAKDTEPDIVVIVVSLKGGTESVTKYISGQTVQEVCSKLFGDGTIPAKKPRAKRRTRAEMQTKVPEAEDAPGTGGEGESPAAWAALETGTKPRSRKIFA